MSVKLKLFAMIALLSVGGCNRTDAGERVYQQFVTCSASYSKSSETAKKWGLKDKPDAMEFALLGGVAGSGRTLGKSDTQIAGDLDRAWKLADGGAFPDNCDELLRVGSAK